MFPCVQAIALSLLIQFAYRLTFGMALAMACTSPRYVTGGYYRNHLYVLLGLNVLATMVALWNPQHYALWPPVTAAALSYLGSVFWLYEKAGPGILALLLIALVALFGAWQAHRAALEGEFWDKCTPGSTPAPLDFCLAAPWPRCCWVTGISTALACNCFRCEDW